MSLDPRFTTKITLLDKTETNRTILAVLGDTSEANLTPHRKQGSYTFAGVKKK